MLTYQMKDWFFRTGWLQTCSSQVGIILHTCAGKSIVHPDRLVIITRKSSPSVDHEKVRRHRDKVNYFLLSHYNAARYVS